MTPEHEAELQLHEQKHRWSSALHEAGHAIAGVACGLRVEWVRLKYEEANGSSGRIRFRRSGEWWGFGRLIATMAGGIAERNYYHYKTSFGCGTDRRIFTSIVNDCDVDRRHAKKTARKLAQNIVRTYRTQIEAVATALMKREQLSGREVKTIFNKAFQPL